jgi:alkaline phosphatase
VTWVPRVNAIDTKGHTGEDVPLYAGGPGAGRFAGVLDNAEIPGRLREVLGW